MQSDASQGDKVYKNIVRNTYLDQSQGTSYTRLIVSGGNYAVVAFDAFHVSLDWQAGNIVRRLCTYVYALCLLARFGQSGSDLVQVFGLSGY